MKEVVFLGWAHVRFRHGRWVHWTMVDTDGLGGSLCLRVHEKYEGTRTCEPVTCPRCLFVSPLPSLDGVVEYGPPSTGPAMDGR